MRMTTCREPNGCITQVQILISKRRSYSFRRDNHLSYRKESWGCNIQLEQRLVIGFIRDFERIIISDLPSVSPCIQEGRLTMVNRISATLRRVPVIRFRYEGPDQRGFSFCEATIKSRKQFAVRNSHKGGGHTAAWAILFNDGTLKRRGHLIHFRHEFRQIPLPSVVNTFSSGKLTAHRHGTLFCTKTPFWYAQCCCSLRVSAVSWQSDHTAICLSSVCRLLLFAADQVSSAVYRIWSTPGIAKRRAFLWPVSFSHIVFVLTVSILALVKTPGNHLLNALISDYPLHFLFS